MRSHKREQGIAEMSEFRLAETEQSTPDAAALNQSQGSSASICSIPTGAELKGGAQTVDVHTVEVQI